MHIDKKTGKNVCKGLRRFIAQNRIPNELLTDNGTEFVNRWLIEYCEGLNI